MAYLQKKEQRLHSSVIYPELKKELEKLSNVGTVGLCIIHIFKKNVKKQEWYINFTKDTPRMSLEAPVLLKKTPVVIIEVQDKDLLNFITGGLTGIQAISQKKVKILGDLELAQELEVIFNKAGGVKKASHFLTHFISKAAWWGSKILSTTISPESPILLNLFKLLFTNFTIDDLASKSQLDETRFSYFLEYAAQVFYNLGNYKSFGDTKFIPRLKSCDFDKIIHSSESNDIITKYENIKHVIYSLEPQESLLLGYPADLHVSGYYSSNVSKSDVEFVQKALEEHNISALNTRLFKNEHGYVLKVASADSDLSKTINYQGSVIQVAFGDFSKEMKMITAYMELALPFCANSNQEKMISSYIESFKTGSMESHKESQRHWIKDMGPVVETNIGFIETYRDPAGVRAEWEGFVAIVNKEMTKKFESLVNNAPKFIELLPWSKDFEKDSFMKPDFTSLEVLSFATSGSPPSGINIPNYDDIRQNLGFKNVSLGNIISAKSANEKITFIKECDLELFEKYQREAFEVQVGLHELLGHGSGKLLSEVEPGVYNFDINNPPISPLTKEKIKSFYKPGETWGSVFKSCAASYEECRAELVAMYLCVERQVLEIFGYTNEKDQDDIIYICYLNMARSGLLALEFYDPKSKKWGQAHMQARYSILQSLIESGTVSVNSANNDLLIELDRTKIISHGLPAISKFLCTLQVYKATADALHGLEFYDKVTSVNEEFVEYREIVILMKQPRKIFVQGNTFLEDDEVVLKEYDLDLRGFIMSVCEREF